MSTRPTLGWTPLGLSLNDIEKMSKLKCKAPRKWKGLYHYRYGRIDTPERLGWLEQIVLRHQLYIPKPGELNDPLEARPKIAKAAMDKFIETIYANYVKANPGMSTDECAYHRRVIDFNFRKYGIDWAIKSFEQGLAKEFESQRIYSLSKRPDNLHLWQHYAAKHTGYCLEFRHAGILYPANEVRYQEHFEADVTGPAQLIGSFYFYKTPRWRREEELRLVGRRNAHSGIIDFDPSSLTRIFLGRRMHPDHQAIIREWAERIRKPVLSVACASEMELY